MRGWAGRRGLVGFRGWTSRSGLMGRGGGGEADTLCSYMSAFSSSKFLRDSKGQSGTVRDSRGQ